MGFESGTQDREGEIAGCALGGKVPRRWRETTADGLGHVEIGKNRNGGGGFTPGGGREVREAEVNLELRTRKLVKASVKVRDRVKPLFEAWQKRNLGRGKTKSPVFHSAEKIGFCSVLLGFFVFPIKRVCLPAKVSA